MGKSLLGRLALLVCCIFCIRFHVEAVLVDPTFTSPIAGPYASLIDILPAEGGSVYVAGSFAISSNQFPQSRVVRLEADGTIDSRFILTTSNAISAMALDLQGRLLVGVMSGSTSAVHRYFSDRQADPAFSPPWFSSGTNGGAVLLNAISVDPQGRIVVGGSFREVNGLSRSNLVRLLPNGEVDTTFAAGTNVHGQVSTLAVLPSGRVAIGVFNVPAVRLLERDGSLVGTFNFTNLGTVVVSLHVSPRGELFGVGRTSIGGSSVPFFRILENGQVDPSFRPFSATPYFATDLEFLPDGSFLVAGMFSQVGGRPRPGLARFLANGSLDHCYYFDGFELDLLAYTTSPKLTSSAGTTYFMGNFVQLEGHPTRALARVFTERPCADGTVSFGAQQLQISEDSGTLQYTVVRSGQENSSINLEVQVVNGTAVEGDDFRLPRKSFELAPGQSFLNIPLEILKDGLAEADEFFELRISGISPGFTVLNSGTIRIVDTPQFIFGKPDAVFSSGNTNVSGSRQNIGKVRQSTDGSVFALEANLFGFNDPATRSGMLTRYSPNGRLDWSFSTNSKAGLVREFELDSQGRPVLVAATSPVVLRRLLQDGRIDPSFVPPTVLNSNKAMTIGTLRVLPGDRIIVGGYFVLTDGKRFLTNLALLEPSGAFVPEFKPVVGEDRIDRIYLNAEHVYISRPSSLPPLQRLRMDGSIDPLFNYSSSWVTAAAVQPDGKIIVAEASSARIRRLNLDGTVDPAFTQIQLEPLQQQRIGQTPPNLLPEGMILQPDGKLLVAGEFGVAGRVRSWVMRFHPDGRLDRSFDAGVVGPSKRGPIFARETISLAVFPQLDGGGVLVAGDFDTFGGVASESIISLGAPRAALRPNLTLFETDVGPSSFMRVETEFQQGKPFRLQRSVDLVNWSFLASNAATNNGFHSVLLTNRVAKEFFRMLPLDP